MTPRVSVGMPVYNGESFLREALDSLLAQTYGGFELIISDNGSTDATEDICRACAARDRRIRYYRNDVNRGAAWNFNRCFALARGRFFKWAAHDDVCGSTFLERCVAVLEQAPEVVLSYCRIAIINAAGRLLNHYQPMPVTGAASAGVRFRHIVCGRKSCCPVFGLIRSDALRRTQLIGNYVFSDVALLAELSLLGRFHELEEYLFMVRAHPDSSLHANRTHEAVAQWYDPAHRGRWVCPRSRLWWEHLKSVRQATVAPDVKWRCCTTLALEWPRAYWRHVGGEARRGLLRTARRLTGAAANGAAGASGADAADGRRALAGVCRPGRLET